MSVVDNTLATTSLLPETDAQRQKLRTVSFILIACGVVGFIGAFATYWLGYALAIMYFVAAGITIAHTKSAREVLTSACCLTANGAFSNLRMAYVCNAIGTGVGILFCIAGIVFHLRKDADKATGSEGRKENSADVALAIVALVACIVGLPLNVIAAQTCGKIHVAVDPILNKRATQIVSGNLQQGGVVMGTVHSMEHNNGTSPYGAPHDGTTVQVYPAAIPVESSPATYQHQQQHPHQPNGPQIYSGYPQPQDNEGYCNQVHQQRVRTPKDV